MKISLKQSTEARKRRIKLQETPKSDILKTEIQEIKSNKNNNMI